MNILVCITHVPDTISRISFMENNTKFDTNGIQFIIGPYDDYALSRGVELKEQFGGKLTVLNIGLAETEPTLRKALAIGADEAVRIHASPEDSFFVAQNIALYAQSKSFDLILMGRESIDFNGGMVHGMVGELLGIPSLSPIMKLDIQEKKAKITKEIEGGKEYLEVDLPFVAGCQEPIAEWKIPNMRGIMQAKSKPLTVLEPYQNTLYTQNKNFELPKPKGQVKMIAQDNIKTLLQLLKEEAKVI
ncbi:MAG: electron transfer flavoprotein subunit beta/FixA family protein [Chitinophagaceae bacterium]|nr:electron transfer flavoprotein subunit beta/FixA family protein [Chitinophagaceae bacterium]